METWRNEHLDRQGDMEFKISDENGSPGDFL
jgi:hypothetical protein